MKIHIDNVHINVPRETKPAPSGLSHAELARRNTRQKETIQELRRRIQEAGDIPVNTVTQKYHTQQIRNQGEAHREEIQRFMEQSKKLQGQLIACKEATRRIRKDRDELLEAATKPSTKAEKALAGLGAATPQGADLTFRGKPRKYRQRMTDEEVWQIRRFIKAGRSNVWIAKQTGLKASALGKIRRGETYADIAAEPKGSPICLHVGWGVTKQTKKDKAND